MIFESSTAAAAATHFPALAYPYSAGEKWKLCFVRISQCNTLKKPEINTHQKLSCILKSVNNHNKAELGNSAHHQQAFSAVWLVHCSLLRHSSPKFYWNPTRGTSSTRALNAAQQTASLFKAGVLPIKDFWPTLSETDYFCYHTTRYDKRHSGHTDLFPDTLCWWGFKS